MSKNVVFSLFRPIKWPISREPLIRFSISFFLNAQNLILNRLYRVKFLISPIVFSKNAENLFSDLAIMKLAILKNSDVMEKKMDSGFGLSDPKLYGNKWFCFRTKNLVNFVDLCNHPLLDFEISGIAFLSP